MAMIALMQCYGGYIQNDEARVVINSKGTREALAVDAGHLQERDDERGLRLDGGVEQHELRRRPALAGAERDLDRAHARELGLAALGPARGSLRSRAARTSGSGSST